MRIAVFADGTWNKMDAMDKGTNVVKLCQATPKDEAKGQTKFYDAGVGTRWYERLRGGAFGVGISQNIKDCYGFIVEKWTGPQDEIFLFGFSRGAYTVRSLAGLLNFVGIVRDESAIDQAYDFYRDAKKIAPKTEDDKKKFDPKRKAEFESFRQKNVRDLDQRARIKLVGVWDTVGALGIPQSWLNAHLNPVAHEFHDTALGGNVEHAVHAVSIDEKRKAFEPTLWDPDPRALQIFFTGVHSDVGGGYKDDRKLGDITLRWMAEQAAKHGLQARLVPDTRADRTGILWQAARVLDGRLAPRPALRPPHSRRRLHQRQRPQAPRRVDEEVRPSPLPPCAAHPALAAVYVD